MSKIEKGVPLPPKQAGGRKARYPWGEMEVGDSILAPAPGRLGDSSAVSSATAYGRRHGKRFSVRRVSPTEARIWRVE